jgi:hypothetical protein
MGMGRLSAQLAQSLFEMALGRLSMEMVQSSMEMVQSSMEMAQSTEMDNLSTGTGQLPMEETTAQAVPVGSQPETKQGRTKEQQLGTSQSSMEMGQSPMELGQLSMEVVPNQAIPTGEATKAAVSKEAQRADGTD